MGRDRFLAAYEKCGTIKSASKAAGINRETVRRWQNGDKLGFRVRFQSAQETFREELEEIMFERLRDSKCHPVLIIFALKGHWREKYGDVQTSVDDTPREILNELKAIAKGRREPQRQEQEEEPESRAAMDEVEQIMRQHKGNS